MKDCKECNSEEFVNGCNYCRDKKITTLIADNKQLKQENKFLKNELELINEQNST